MITSGSVMPAELPKTVYVDPLDGRGHARMAGQMTHCYLPLAELHESKGPLRVNGIRTWCDLCFPGNRCTRRVSDTWGTPVGLCGQPSWLGDECWWHIHDDNTEDKRHERWAA